MKLLITNIFPVISGISYSCDSLLKVLEFIHNIGISAYLDTRKKIVLAVISMIFYAIQKEEYINSQIDSYWKSTLIPRLMTSWMLMEK